MHVDIERSARDNLVRLLDDVGPDDIDADGDMVNDYGLTSLNKVLFLMSLCNDTAMPSNGLAQCQGLK